MHTIKNVRKIREFSGLFPNVTERYPNPACNSSRKSRTLIYFTGKQVLAHHYCIMPPIISIDHAPIANTNHPCAFNLLNTQKHLLVIWDFFFLQRSVMSNKNDRILLYLLQQKCQSQKQIVSLLNGVFYSVLVSRGFFFCCLLYTTYRTPQSFYAKAIIGRYYYLVAPITNLM
jgi:hypothetical protein